MDRVLVAAVVYLGSKVTKREINRDQSRRKEAGKAKSRTLNRDLIARKI